MEILHLATLKFARKLLRMEIRYGLGQESFFGCFFSMKEHH